MNQNPCMRNKIDKGCNLACHSALGRQRDSRADVTDCHLQSYLALTVAPRNILSGFFAAYPDSKVLGTGM